jgi:hypothetical protein
MIQSGKKKSPHAIYYCIMPFEFVDKCTNIVVEMTDLDAESIYGLEAHTRL